MTSSSSVATTRLTNGDAHRRGVSQTELGGDPGAVRAFATAASELGFAHIAVFDHVVGADPAVHRGWSGPCDVHTTFHELFVLVGYLAALTSLELVTSVVILPQRQTVLVAKQAAEIDLLTGVSRRHPFDRGTLGIGGCPGQTYAVVAGAAVTPAGADSRRSGGAGR